MVNVAADGSGRRRRLARGALTPELIVEESLRLLDTGGVSGFSLPKLGRVLGADPTAVYRHFASKDELVLAIADRLIEEAIAGFEPSECWVEIFGELFRRLRDVYQRHPAAASVSALRTTQRPAELQAVEWLVGAARLAGFEGAQAALMYRTIAEFSLSWCGHEAMFNALDPEQQEADRGAWTRSYRSVDAGEFPNIWAIHDDLPEVSEDAMFEQALAVIVAGISALAPRQCPCPPGTHDVPSADRQPAQKP